jgi:HEAT repeat protein
MMTAVFLLGLAAALGGQDDKAVEEALDAFKTGIKSPSEADRVTAVNELSKVHHAKTLQRLAALLVGDGPTVRIAAARGISGFAELKKQASHVLIAGMAANAKDATVLAALYDCLGKLDDDSSLATLHRGFEEKELSVAKAAIQATGQVASPSSIDPLIALLAKLEKLLKSSGSVDYTAPVPGGGSSVTVRSEDNPAKRAQELIPVVNKTLNEITRESNGTSESWSAWWAKNRAGFKPVK